MTRFRPCIDLHEGKVKQIVGGSLRDDAAGLRTNFESDQPAEYFAGLYQRDGLTGGHVIKLGPGNDDAARAALAAYPGGMQVGGGINLVNAPHWLAAGGSHVILLIGGRDIVPLRRRVWITRSWRLVCLVFDIVVLLDVSVLNHRHNGLLRGVLRQRRLLLIDRLTAQQD